MARKPTAKPVASEPPVPVCTKAAAVVDKFSLKIYLILEMSYQNQFSITGYISGYMK